MESIDRLPSLKELLVAHDLWAKKSLGQNFLLNPAITDRIAKAARTRRSGGAQLAREHRRFRAAERRTAR